MTEKENYALCSTVYLKNHEDKFLLIKHKKLEKWVPPGGKLEPYELPHDAAFRECWEETGLEVEFLAESLSFQSEILQPRGIEYNTASLPNASHLDFIFFAQPKSSQKITLSTFEATEARWYTLGNISELNTFPSIYYWCKTFLLEHSLTNKYHSYSSKT